MSETMTSARQLASRMRLSGAMTRKYAQAYEAITGDRIAIVGRDGRQFTDPQRDAMLLAKGFLDENPGMSVDTAMRAALGRAEIAVKHPGGDQGIDALVEALGKVATPLQAELEGIREELAELPELRRELVELRQEVAKLRELPAASSIPKPPSPSLHRRAFGGAGDEHSDSEHDRERAGRDGVLVRVARRLESILRA